MPPLELAARVGSVEGVNPLEFYDREGAAVRARLERLLPPDWSFQGKRVLDFGCGSARVLRHFLPEAHEAAFWGCDIDRPSIEWVSANLSPPLHCFQNEAKPPLPLDSNSFDLVWATSVFTHIGDLWSDWLLELHRILAPGAIMVATFLGEGIWDALVGEPYDEEAIGMTTRRHWTLADAWIFHSEWWLREHWGRAFEITEIVRPPRLDDGSPQITHSYIAMRKRPVELTREDLQRADSAEPRELAALQTNFRLLRGEVDALVDELQTATTPTVSLLGAVRSSALARPARRIRSRLRAAR